MHATPPFAGANHAALALILLVLTGTLSSASAQRCTASSTISDSTSSRRVS